MKTPKFQPMVRAAAALAIALAGTLSAGALSAVPALAEAGSGTPAPAFRLDDGGPFRFGDGGPFRFGDGGPFRFGDGGPDGLFPLSFR